MTAAVFLFPIVPRPNFGDPSWSEQFRREHEARIAMRQGAPHRTRPMLVISDARRAPQIDRDNYQSILDGIARFMNEGRAALCEKAE
ncbi:hypothetical protein LOC51_19980 [Rubrivivax sp. JA1024]|uniref:hypothetical protein n=1 Tax=Rhodopseudomonas sp. G2_2311 TaxID=3114287 RepID=UPI001E4C7971|nr:hypothetical protein [Rubrivivax sp. JA1024]